MSDAKISELPAASAVVASDLLPIVNDPGGTPETQRATFAQVLAYIAGSSTFQPLDSDLTAIAALSTTPFGRALLTLADASAARTTLAFAPAVQPIGATPDGGSTLYGIPDIGGVILTTRSLIAGRIYYMPFSIDRDITLNGVQIEVTAGSAGLIRLGLCRLGVNGQPPAIGGLVRDAGAVDCTSPAVLSITGLGESLPPGSYAIVLKSNATPTLRAIRGTKTTWLRDIWGANGLVATMRGTEAYGAFADPLTPWNVSDHTGNGFEWMVGLQWSTT